MISDKQLNQFLYQLQEKQSRIMVVGLGYTGLPLAECIANAGFKVVGYDTNINKVEMLIRGESYLETVSVFRIQELLETKIRFSRRYFLKGSQKALLVFGTLSW